MNKTRHGNVALIALSLLLMAQIGYVALRRSNAPPPVAVRFVTEGDALDGLLIEEDGRAWAPFQEGDAASPTIFLVFHSECAHCDLVAEAWRTWLAGPHHGVRVYAVSREELPAARAYAKKHAWDVDVSRLPDDAGPEGRSLLMRTPWLVLTDGAGVVRFQGHGSRLEELDIALATLTRDG